MHSEFMKYVDKRLEEWAQWYGQGNWYGLSFPNCTLDHRLQIIGIVEKNTRPQPLPCNDDAEEIEALVVELAEYGKEIAQSLRLRYFGAGTIPRRAVSIGISYAQFKSNVIMGRLWLAGRLTAKYRRRKKIRNVINIC